MPLLIDGHNLIGSGVFDDIRLSDEDDEIKLVSRLRVWRSNYRGAMTVIFDHGITGGLSRELSGGGVQVIFARNPQEADDLIRRRMGQRPQGLVVVTNDAALRRAAAAHGVEVWRADEFVHRMKAAPRRHRAQAVEPGAEMQVNLSAAEVEEWLELFDSPPEPSAPASRRSQPRKRSSARPARKPKRRGSV